jgi:hypothetical protein
MPRNNKSKSYIHTRPRTPTIYNFPMNNKYSLERKQKVMDYSNIQSNQSKQSNQSSISKIKDSFFQGVGFSLAHNLVSEFFGGSSSSIRSDNIKESYIPNDYHDCNNIRNDYHDCNNIRNDYDNCITDYQLNTYNNETYTEGCKKIKDMYVYCFT